MESDAERRVASLKERLIEVYVWNRGKITAKDEAEFEKMRAITVYIPRCMERSRVPAVKALASELWAAILSLDDLRRQRRE